MPQFSAGTNIALKVPQHQYQQTLAFYRDILALPQLEAAASATESVRFAFGDKVLWVDCMAGLSQAEIWLEILTDDAEAAARHFQQLGIARRDEIEPLPDGFQGFWIATPSNLIHLVQQR